jgi:hypothetical protein
MGFVAYVHGRRLVEPSAPKRRGKWYAAFFKIKPGLTDSRHGESPKREIYIVADSMSVGQRNVHVGVSAKASRPAALLKLDIDFESFVCAVIAGVITADSRRRRKEKVRDQPATVGDSTQHAPESECDQRRGLGLGNAIC